MQSYYINPNTRGLTSNYKNTVIKDKEAYNEAMSRRLLNPVEDLGQVLKTSGKSASSTAQAAYEQLKANNRTYQFADEKTKKQIAYISDYYLQTVPESVKTAWQETLEETGFNPFQTDVPSTLTQLSVEQDFLTGGNDNILGETKESCLAAIDKILERIEHPLAAVTEERAAYLQQEKEFYTVLASKIGENNNVKPGQGSDHSEYQTENYRIVPDREAECFDIYNKDGEHLGAFSYSDIKIRQDAATGKQFLISEHGTMSYDTLVLDEELKEALQSVMDTDSLDVETHKFSTWQKVFDEIGGSYERVWSKEELDQGYLNN